MIKNDFNKSINACIHMLEDMKTAGYETCSKSANRKALLNQLNNLQSSIRVLEDSLGLYNDD